MLSKQNKKDYILLKRLIFMGKNTNTVILENVRTVFHMTDV